MGVCGGNRDDPAGIGRLIRCVGIATDVGLVGGVYT